MTAARLFVFRILTPTGVGTLIPKGVRAFRKSILPYLEITLVPFIASPGFVLVFNPVARRG